MWTKEQLTEGLPEDWADHCGQIIQKDPPIVTVKSYTNPNLPRKVTLQITDEGVTGTCTCITEGLCKHIKTAYAWMTGGSKESTVKGVEETSGTDAGIPSESQRDGPEPLREPEKAVVPPVGGPSESQPSKPEPSGGPIEKVPFDSEQDMMKALRRPFPEEDIEWRISRSGFKDDKPWAKVLAYTTARGVQDRLDEVFGILGWKVSYEVTEYQECNEKNVCVTKTGMLCTISVRTESGEWISKADGAQATDFEPFKGGISGAFKRTGAAGFGIGRYLYGLDETWAETSLQRSDKFSNFAKAHGKPFYWATPKLPKWAVG